MLRRRPLAGARRTHPRRRSVRGRGIWDSIKSGFNYVAPAVAPVLRDFGVKLLKSKLGVGRRRRVRRRVGGATNILGLARRRRRVRRGSAMIAGFGKTRRRRRMGRGPGGSILGSVAGRLLGSLLPF